jgi:large conductance mechanosensitive channel
MLRGFRQFILRGNVVDMAVGVVIGAAFAGVVTAFTKDILTPFIAAIVGKPDFSAISFTINNSVFAIGDFINAALSFLLIAAAVYFFVVTPINNLVSRMRKAPAPADPTTRKCPECMSEILTLAVALTVHSRSLLVLRRTEVEGILGKAG